MHDTGDRLILVDIVIVHIVMRWQRTRRDGRSRDIVRMQRSRRQVPAMLGLKHQCRMRRERHNRRPAVQVREAGRDVSRELDYFCHGKIVVLDRQGAAGLWCLAWGAGVAQARGAAARGGAGRRAGHPVRRFCVDL